MISDQLKNKINQIPELPGIYKMLDGRGNIIYIGKSKCLKKRVKSYFTGTPKADKVKKLVSFIRDIEIQITDTHLEARLLECDLIKSIMPVFNSQMKQDRGYAYLTVEDYNPYHLLSVSNERTSNSYGPFRSSYSLKELAKQMKNLYPIKFDNNTYVFEYRLSPVKLDQNSFHENRTVLLNMLSEDDNISLFIEKLEEKMKEAASEYYYETASRYRDLISGMRMIKFGINGYKNLTSQDILLIIPTPAGYKLFYVAKGIIIYHRLHPANPTEQDKEDFIQAARSSSSPSYPDMDEKAAIDFRDILCSEILSLPKEMVRVLPG